MALNRYGMLRDQLLRERQPNVFAPAILREAGSHYIPIPISERLVQCIWYDQRVAAGDLHATDGRRVQVIFQGWWNLEAGPDFHHATIQVGDEPEQTGDVEVHLSAADWAAHGHDQDSQYNNVVLHVVLWRNGSEQIPWKATGDAVPQVALENQLGAPLEALYDDIDLDAYPHHASGHGGACSPDLARLPLAALQGLLTEAGEERFAAKTRRFVRWIHRVGADQAFYEGWMEALGYKANKVPFRTLARRLPLTQVTAHRGDLTGLLFGVANFLPVTATNDRYVKRLWQTWWKLRPEFAEAILPAAAWRWHGIRPANHPHRRLGAAAVLLKRHGNFLEKVVGTVESNGDPAKFFAQVCDEYWSRHFTLAGKTQAAATDLIGASRAQEMTVNILLPCVAAMATATDDRPLAAKVRERFAALRSQPANSLLRLAGGQLFQSAAAAQRIATTACQQQGLLQIFQDFCLNDKSACGQCQFAELARQWALEPLAPAPS